MEQQRRESRRALCLVDHFVTVFRVPTDVVGQLQCAVEQDIHVPAAADPSTARSPAVCTSDQVDVDNSISSLRLSLAAQQTLRVHPVVHIVLVYVSQGMVQRSGQPVWMSS